MTIVRNLQGEIDRMPIFSNLGKEKEIAFMFVEIMAMFYGGEMTQEIFRACGRQMYNLIPDDKKEELNKALKMREALAEKIEAGKKVV